MLLFFLFTDQMESQAKQKTLRKTVAVFLQEKQIFAFEFEFIETISKTVA